MPAPDYLRNMEFKQRGDRKASKPLMEKRRRARINHCLSQLKSLVIDKTESENSRQTKLEKADILELTVRHLHEIKRHQRTVSLVNDPRTKKKFELGFVECAREVESFFSSCVQLDEDLKMKLKSHLFERIKDIGNHSSLSEEESSCSPPPPPPPPPSVAPCSRSGKSPSSYSPPLSSTEDGVRQDEISLIPKRLPNGDLAVVIPPHLLTGSLSCVSCPLSAFRLICSSWPQADRRQSPSTSLSSTSPLSSAASDVSEESNHGDVNPIERHDFSAQSVWRPW